VASSIAITTQPNTQKGSRISVHVYSRQSESAIKEAIETYISTRRQLKEVGCKVPPE
jgi:hypothetical protein